ncbi:CRISPR-associated protein Cas6 [Neosynechococcus sphagnicola sy1]|uniref:CRISPR-associated protein Cas6 n=1 Tax=Neosynechococcus sphagnicola sy1 TaxID=1497020 RepID=A0A098TL94_9CYAN|nr:CRISPR-associated protein Cas6 [Neosynechococcus sphagnicola sy1]
MLVPPYVELSFGVIGETLPADHGYGLYSAISKICPALHEQEGVSIQTITGIPDRRGRIYLTKDKSFLRIRLPYDPDLISRSLTLAGKQLTIGNHRISLGIPQFLTLQPADILKARIVVIKGFQDAEAFLKAAKYKLQLLDINGVASIPLNEKEEPDRKTIKIKSFTVVGFGVVVENLTAEDSIKLQVAGIGGKHRMGCGVFVPFRGEA